MRVRAQTGPLRRRQVRPVGAEPHIRQDPHSHVVSSKGIGGQANHRESRLGQRPAGRMIRRGLTAAAASAVVVLSFATLFAPPAKAQGNVTVSGTLAVAPGPTPPNNVISVVPFTAGGHFHVDGGFQPTFDWVTVNLVWNKGGPGPSAMFVECGSPPGGPTPPAPACSGSDVASSRKISPAYNGTYQLTAQGQGTDQ